MEKAQLDLIRTLLSAQSTLALATTAADGSPHIAPLFFLLRSDLSLCWLSAPSSLHSQNLAANPAASVTVFRPTENWKEICGVQMRGSVEIIRERKQRAAILDAYMERFALKGVLRVAIARSRLYCFRPAWIRYIDNSRGFGYKFEITLAPS